MTAFLTEIVISGACFLLSFLISLKGIYVLSGAVLIVFAAADALRRMKSSGRILEPAAVFTLSWVGGAGISSLKLSFLQTDWDIKTWLAIFLTYACFIFAYSLKAGINKGKKAEAEGRAFLAAGNKGGALINEIPTAGARPCGGDGLQNKLRRRGLLISINIVTLISLAAFLTEVYILKFIPLFTSGTPHAYSYFHVSGLHYFTVSCVLSLPLTVIYAVYYGRDGMEGALKKADLFFNGAYSVVLPVLMVSRFQLLFSVMLAAFCFLILEGGRRPFLLNPVKFLPAAGGCLALILLYVFITYERAHSTEYLNGIYEMKYEGLPIFFSQPYIYIANNYDNLNCLITGLGSHTLGLRMLFPVIALTGLKFIRPELCSFPLYITREELTTVSLVYDAYYDFGMPGVAVFSCALGFLAAAAEKSVMDKKGAHPALVLFYGQFLFYLACSFFTTWFSNPTTWFYFAATCGIGVFIWLYAAFMEKYGRNKKSP